MNSGAGFPSYAELRAQRDGCAWGVFGERDELGTLNHLTQQRVRAAAAGVRTGEVVNLDHPLQAFEPGLIPVRKPLRHNMFRANEFHRDEYLDSFYTQCGSQLDGLRHFGHPDFGFYNGIDAALLTEGAPPLGVQRFAEHGIVGRGVLVDLPRYLHARGQRIDYDSGEQIPIETVAAAASEQGVTPQPGDILLLRTGWAGYHLHQIDDARRAQNTSPIRCPGLAQRHETVEWLWDNQFALVATDNFAVEAWPAAADSPFLTTGERDGTVARSRQTGLMHRVLIPLLGMVLGELWALDELAERCAADSRWECLVVASPLTLTGGVGSPANAVAIR